MSKQFKKVWENIQTKSHDVAIQDTLDDVKDKVHEMDEKLDQYETAGGTKKSADYERCVSHVSNKNPGANAHAVCEAVMNEKSLKSFTGDKLIGLIDKALAGMGIVAGGPIPNSLLARQDLEPTTLKSDSVHIHVTFLDSAGKKQTRVFTSKAGYNAWIATVGGQITILAEDIKEKSIEDLGVNTHKSLIERMKRNQKPSVRKGSTFKDLWSQIRATNRGTINK